MVNGYANSRYFSKISIIKHFNIMKVYVETIKLKLQTITEYV